MPYVLNRWFSTRQLPTANRQSPTTNRQPRPTANRHQLPTDRQPGQTCTTNQRRLRPRWFVVHVTHLHRPAGWYWYDEILQDRGFSALVARQAVEAATSVCGGPCVWFDWLDPMFLNCHTVFDVVDSVPPIHLTQMYDTVQQAFDALKPSPYNDNQWIPQRSRVMRMLLEHVLNQSDAL